MNISRIVEIRMYDSMGQALNAYDIDASTNLMSKRWPKLVYSILRQAISTCLTGGIVVMRGTLEPK